MPGFAAAAELACLLTTRSEAFHPKAFITGIIAITLGVFLIPLFVTGTWSYGAASTECYDRAFALRNATRFDVESQRYDPDWEMDDAADWHLFPVHLFNSTSTAVSLFGLCVWLFFSPHLSVQDMDRTLGSYFGLQWLANLLVTATALGDNCTASETAHTPLFLIELLATFGLSIIGTNLLCHRYLYEKARAMIQLLDDPNDPSVKWLKWLEGSFVWEARSLYFVAVGAPAFIIYPPAGLAIGGLGVLVVVAMDTVFSVVVTLIFLRPIYNVLGNHNAAGQRSAAYRSLQKTKYTTLAGASLAVVSSTALYINFGLFVVLGGYGKPFYANPYLNVMVFGTNLDSVLNDVGMLLACGVIKTFWASWTRQKTTVAPVNNAPLARRGLNSVIDVQAPNSLREAFEETQMAPQAVDHIISGKIDSLAKLRPHAANVVAWLIESLPKAHENDALKKTIKNLLGVARFTTNLQHLGVWDGLIRDCKSAALLLGNDMQKYFVDSHLGRVLGQGAPNVYGKFVIGEDGLRHVVQCTAEEGVRRQDDTIPAVFPLNQAYSQLWSEQCFIHCLRMIAMAINDMFQILVSGVCDKSKGAFKGCTIKGFVRMLNKCISRDDHYWEKFPRPSLNIDLNRNACTFKCPEDLLLFIKYMKEHPMIGSCPVRIKNMFLFDDNRAEQQFYYRTVMINWLFTPNITYGELAKLAKPLWERYYDFQGVSGHGDMDPSESWGTWRKQIEVATAFLTSPDLKDKQVQFIVETQLLLHPYLIGRQRMHLLYKLCRADNPDALYSDFLAFTPEVACFDEAEDAALDSMKVFVAEANDINEALNGVTRLWTAAKLGQHKAVYEILQHAQIDPNKACEATKTTPLCTAAYHGHVKVVTALLGHPEIRVNLGKLDTNASPLFEAAQEGREEVMLELLGASRVDINQATTEGVSPLCVACELGHEHVVDCLLKAHGVDVDHKLKNCATALAIAAIHGHVKIIENLAAHSRRNGLEIATGAFPVEDQFECTKQYHEAVVKWAEAAAQPKFPLSKEPKISSVKSKILSNRNSPSRKYLVVHDPCDEQKSE